MSDDTFDPTAVPPYPIYTIEMDDAGRVTVDGVAIGDGDDATERAIEHIAELIRADEQTAARVRALTPEGTYRMVVDADGGTHELPEETVPDGKITIGKRKVSRRALAAATVTVAGLVVIGAAVPITIALTRQEPAPVATTPPIPGEGEQMPVLAPPGYEQTAAYAIPIRDRSNPYFLPDGRIAITTPNDALRLIDPATGYTVWRGNNAPRAGAELVATTIGGYDVLATGSRNRLTVWPLYLEGTAAVDAVEYDLPRGATASFLGVEPLVTLPDQTAAFVTADGLAQVDIPVTSTAVLVDEDGIVAVDDDTIYTVDHEGEVTDTVELASPEGSGEISRVSAADDDTLIVTWGVTGQNTSVVGLVDRHSGEILASANARANATREDTRPIHALDAETLTYGNVFIRFDDTPQVVPLADFTPTAITGTMVYGTYEREAAQIDAGAEQPEAIPFTTQDLPLDPIPPIGVTTEMAWIVAEKVDETLLYALAPTQAEPDPTDTTSPQ